MRILSLLKLLLVLFLSSITITAQIYKSDVKGRVVDNNGNPVINAIVAFEPKTGNTANYGSSTAVYTDKDGKFTLENVSSQSTRKIDIYISGPFPQNAIRLVDLPPKDSLRRLKPDLKIGSISLTESKSIDIGDVQIKVWSNLVEVTLVKSNGKPYFETKRDWESIFIVLRSAGGEIVVAEGISQYDSKLRINSEEGLIRFVIAEGTWQIEFISVLDNLESIFASTDKFSIKQGSEPLKIRLVVSEKDFSKPKISKTDDF